MNDPEYKSNPSAQGAHHTDPSEVPFATELPEGEIEVIDGRAMVNGRAVVNRDWMVKRTGAARVTVNLWYRKRHEAPEYMTDDEGNEVKVPRHPEKKMKIRRVDFYDEREFEAFYAALQLRKKQKVLPTSPDLYEGDVEDRISINQAAEFFHFAGPNVIRKYLKDNPGYFPDSVGTVEGPSGRQIPAFRRGDLQDFDRKRQGDNTGTAGRPEGHPQSRERKPETEERIATALAFIREQGGHRRGMGAQLAARHNEPTWKWERAVKEARMKLIREGE
ncbi:hypothetical protein HUT19_41090 [Streptomyces sp. NA02950]|uniref:hypothetical protein n=1 Tax=Streptomyces sp. NA02950 TaxID=2742137 RepID=UPI0015924167|nr:hypothetical protein [Streptomyces sp. NA02950]QKV90388.1 hypothetical protein HUT19_00130 [Streptomyces sp. NA02950]QKV97279.1 hypothetical protein HUT19_41090 [Streptomyces sp. NA02950]